MKTFREYLAEINKLAKDFPQSLDYQVIYSHDDEDNEFQRVINKPSLCQLENPKQKSYRNLELVGFYNEDDIVEKDCNAVIIN